VVGRRILPFSLPPSLLPPSLLQARAHVPFGLLGGGGRWRGEQDAKALLD
jgi:hypothetical protein